MFMNIQATKAPSARRRTMAMETMTTVGDDGDDGDDGDEPRKPSLRPLTHNPSTVAGWADGH